MKKSRDIALIAIRILGIYLVTSGCIYIPIAIERFLKMPQSKLLHTSFEFGAVAALIPALIYLLAGSLCLFKGPSLATWIVSGDQDQQAEPIVKAEVLSLAILVLGIVMICFSLPPLVGISLMWAGRANYLGAASTQLSYLWWSNLYTSAARFILGLILCFASKGLSKLLSK